MPFDILIQQPNNPERKDNEKIFKLEFQGKEIEIKYKTSFFEYPESVKKEAGILGYERKVVSAEQICEALLQIISEEQLILIKEKTNIDLKSTTNIKLFQQALSITSSLKYEAKNYQIFRETFEKLNMFSKKILLSLTNNEFPAKTFTYVMAKYYKQSAEYKKQFSDDKFLLQDVYGYETYKKLVRGSGHSLQNPTSGSDSSTFLIFDKVTDKKLQGDDFKQKNLDGDVNTAFKSSGESLKNDEASIISGNGLNVCDNNFYFDYNILNDEPTFGFSPKDNLFQDYIKKNVDRLRGINIKNLSKVGQEKPFGETLFGERLFLELFSIQEASKSLKHLASPEKVLDRDGHGQSSPVLNEISTFTDGQKEKPAWYTGIIEKLYKKYGSTLSEKEDFILNSARDGEVIYGMNGKHIFKSIHFSDALSYHIPVFINDREIPQLKWGHAKYASFLTKNGFNVLEVKHAEKFPENESKLEKF